MKVLVVGSGGREHALCLALARSPLCHELICAPGNAGIADIARCIPIAAEDCDSLLAFARDTHVDFVVVGPEGPLVAGLVDRLTALGIKSFGPTAAAAALEGSKGFMKDLCARYHVPTAAYGRFTEPNAAKAFVRQQGVPIVVKADGLAAGKGVVICQTVEEADNAIDDAMLVRRFGSAGAELVIEAFLDGEEVSFFALCDGVTALPLAGAQDHKRAFDGDLGPNTGGMGAYSPTPVLTPDLEAQIMRDIIAPTLAGMRAEGRPFTGILFAGIMVGRDAAGTPVPTLLEFNTRFGDPECQVLMARLRSDLLTVLLAAVEQRLADITLDWDPRPALTVVMAAKGYPGDYAKGTIIAGLDAAAALPDVTIIHAGTRRATEDGPILAHGGRVLAITALGITLEGARASAYAAIDQIDWPEGFCRRDIAWRALGQPTG